MSTKEALMNELVNFCEIRGEGSPEMNAAVEKTIAMLEKQIAELEASGEEVRYTLWKTGYTVQQALSVTIVGETAKAIKFKVLGVDSYSDKERTFFMPKSAVRPEKKYPEILLIAKWFAVEGYLNFLFDRYGSAYKR